MHHRHRTTRQAFTLVELLVVMTIFSILLGMLLFALAGATESARQDRTNSQVTRLHELIMDRWNGYRERPLPIRIPPGTNPRNAAQMRLFATWELMRMELPERRSDVIDNPVTLSLPGPALWQAYRRKAEALCGTNWQTAWTVDFQDAECLYLIVSTLRDGDTTGLDFFTAREIGDVDGDGMPEILDAWGQPIRFLRWAPGFVSPLQEANSTTHPDPFDPYKNFPNNYALTPLIFSLGPDRKAAIRLDLVDASGNTTVKYSSQNNNPFYSVTAAPNAPLGIFGYNNKGEAEQGWQDNIANHYIMTR